MRACVTFQNRGWRRRTGAVGAGLALASFLPSTLTPMVNREVPCWSLCWSLTLCMNPDESSDRITTLFKRTGLGFRLFIPRTVVGLQLYYKTPTIWYPLVREMRLKFTGNEESAKRGFATHTTRNQPSRYNEPRILLAAQRKGVQIQDLPQFAMISLELVDKCVGEADGCCGRSGGHDYGRGVSVVPEPRVAAPEDKAGS